VAVSTVFQELLQEEEKSVARNMIAKVTLIGNGIYLSNKESGLPVIFLLFS
jgi:hypothetical protein